MSKYFVLFFMFFPFFVFSQCDTLKQQNVVSQIESKLSERPSVFAGSFKLKKDGSIRILGGSKGLESSIWLYEYNMPLSETEFSIKEKKGKPYYLVIYNESLVAKFIGTGSEKVEGDNNIAKAGNATVQSMDSYVETSGKQYITSVNIEKKIEFELKDPNTAKLLLEELQCILRIKADALKNKGGIIKN